MAKYFSYCQQAMDNCIDILDMANKHICTFCVKSIISSRKLATHLLTHWRDVAQMCTAQKIIQIGWKSEKTHVHPHWREARQM